MSRFLIVVKGDSQDRDETIRGIRQLLKRLGRNFGLRAEIVKPIDETEKATIATSWLSMTASTEATNEEPNFTQ